MGHRLERVANMIIIFIAIYDEKNSHCFSFPGMITSVFMSLLLDISYLKRISM